MDYEGDVSKIIQYFVFAILPPISFFFFFNLHFECEIFGDMLLLLLLWLLQNKLDFLQPINLFAFTYRSTSLK